MSISVFSKKKVRMKNFLYINKFGELVYTASFT